MGKYIIETDETVAGNIQGYLGFPIEICGKRTWVKTDVKLTHYTEPDLDTIRKEAYAEGRKVGIKDGKCEAWEVARKISHMDSKIRDEIFDRVITSNIVDENTASEAIEKIRQYEQEKEEQIQVGDEVVGTYTGGEETEPFVIIRKIPEIDPTYYFGIYSKSGEFCQGGLKLKKTGRHFPEIAEVLAEMKEVDNVID